MKMIRKHGLVLALVMSLMLGGCGEKTARVVSVAELNGTIRVTNQAGTSDAYKGQHLISGDEINVADASDMTIEIDSDKHLYATAGTHFELIAEGTAEISKTRIHLLDGTVLSGIDRKLNEGESYEVNTPNSTMSVRGTVFTVTVSYDENGIPKTEVTVKEGIVQAVYRDENGEETVSVNADESIVIYGADGEVELRTKEEGAQSSTGQDDSDTGSQEFSEEQNEGSDVSESTPSGGETTSAPKEAIDSRYYGVYRGDGTEIVIAPGVTRYYLSTDGIGMVSDEYVTTEFAMISHFESEEPFFGTSYSVAAPNQIVDQNPYVEFSYTFEGDSLQYYRHIFEDDYIENKILIKTGEDPVEIYYACVNRFPKEGEQLTEQDSTEVQPNSVGIYPIGYYEDDADYEYISVTGKICLFEEYFAEEIPKIVDKKGLTAWANAEEIFIPDQPLTVDGRSVNEFVLGRIHMDNVEDNSEILNVTKEYFGCISPDLVERSAQDIDKDLIGEPLYIFTVRYYE